MKSARSNRNHKEKEIDIGFNRKLLRQKSSIATEIYTHVSQKEFYKFKNPIDDMILEDDSRNESCVNLPKTEE